ncbi:hypothetical protein Neosp_003876 [[Neocosmospora] mangrovei]
MPSTPAQPDAKTVAGKCPAARKRKHIRHPARPRRKREPLIFPSSTTHPEPLSLREMRKLRVKTNYLVPVSEIARVCQEILRGMEPGKQVDRFLKLKIEPQAIALLQKEAEIFVVNKFSAAGACAGHAGRTTMSLEDLQVVDEVHGIFEKLGRSFGAKI